VKAVGLTHLATIHSSHIKLHGVTGCNTRVFVLILYIESNHAISSHSESLSDLESPQHLRFQ